MKILRVTPSMNPAQGGPPQGIRASIDAMAGIEIENEVVCCDAPSAPWIGCDSFPVHALGPGKFGFSFTPRMIPWLIKNAQRFDAVVLHGMWQWPGLALLRSAVPRYFLMPHGMLDPWFQRDASRRVKAVRNFIYWWLFERRVVNRAAGVLFTCEEEMRLARTTFGGYRPRTEINVGYGIAPPPDFSEKMRSAFSEKLPDLKGRPYLLFLSRIHPKKGVDLLIQAYSDALSTEKLKASPPCLVIAGPGWETIYGKQMQQLIEASTARLLAENSKRITVPSILRVGMLEGDAKWGALYGCQAFILPSHQENFGIAVVEALACNKPVLISTNVNIWREITDANAGLIMSNDSESIRKSILGFINTLCSKEKVFFTQPLDCYKKYFQVTNFNDRLLHAFSSAS